MINLCSTKKNLLSGMLMSRAISSLLCNLCNYPVRDKAWPSVSCCMMELECNSANHLFRLFQPHIWLPLATSLSDGSPGDVL